MEDSKNLASSSSEKTFCQKHISLKNFLDLCILLTSAYNIVFVPLILGFRIEFKGLFLVCEVLTIIFYFIDVCMRWSNLSRLNMITSIPDSRLNSADQKLKIDTENLLRSVKIEKLEIICSIAACLPIVSMLNFL